MQRAITYTILRYALWAGLLLSLAGCETVGAFRSGDLRRSDISQMAHLSVRKPAPARSQARHAPPCINLASNVKRMQAWINQNLW